MTNPRVRVMCQRGHQPIVVEGFIWQGAERGWGYETDAIHSREDPLDRATGLREWMPQVRESPARELPDGHATIRLNCRRCRADITIEWTNWCNRLDQLQHAGRDVVDLSDLIRIFTMQ